MNFATFLLSACLANFVSGKEGKNEVEMKPTEQPNRPCLWLPPGLEQLAKGVDVTSLDLFPAEPNSDHGFKGTLFEFTCNQKLKWILPSTNVAYDRPDQILSLVSMPAGEQSVETQLHKSMSEYKSSLSGQVGLKADVYCFGSFSASASYKQTKENLMSSHQRVAQTSCSRSSAVIEFRDPEDLRLSHKFKRALSKLKVPFIKHMEAYKSFFEDFGTHYFVRGFFGGLLYSRTTMNESFAKDKTEHNLKAALKETMVGFGAIEGSIELSKGESMSEYSKEFTSRMEYYGGATNLAKSQSIRSWWDSVDANPWLFGGKLKPITDLLMNETIQAEVKAYCLWRSIQVTMRDLEYSVQLVGEPFGKTAILYEARAFFKYPILTEKKLKEQIARIAILQNILEKKR